MSRGVDQWGARSTGSGARDSMIERGTMRPLGVNRVTIGVKDLEKGIELYSKLLGATFYDQSVPAEPFGLRCAISWDAGIELVAPLPGRDSYATALSPHPS